MQMMDRRGLADARKPSVLIAAAQDVPEPICQPLLDGSAARREALPIGVNTPRHGRSGVIARCLFPDAAHASSPRVYV
jgi:hypothetical protein